MAIPTEMQALLLVNDGYTRDAVGQRAGSHGALCRAGQRSRVPPPKPTQLLIKVTLAAINPSDVMFIKGQYGQPRVKASRPASRASARWSRPATSRWRKCFAGQRVAFATGVSRLGLVGRVRDRRSRRLDPADRPRCATRTAPR